MKILIVSDTHGRDEKLEAAVAVEQPFDYLIHCGDVEGREFFIEALAECPCTIVAGNNDFFSDLPRDWKGFRMRSVPHVLSVPLQLLFRMEEWRR